MAERPKRRRSLDRSVAKPYKKTVCGCQHGRLGAETKLHTSLGCCKGGRAEKKTISGWSCSKAFEGAEAQSGNGTKRLRLTASRACLGAEMEHALGAARVAARRKRQGRFLELLQGL